MHSQHFRVLYFPKYQVHVRVTERDSDSDSATQLVVHRSLPLHLSTSLPLFRALFSFRLRKIGVGLGSRLQAFPSSNEYHRILEFTRIARRPWPSEASISSGQYLSFSPPSLTVAGSWCRIVILLLQVRWILLVDARDKCVSFTVN